MKTLVLFTIFVLIFGTVSTSLVSDVYAQNDPNILLRIATQADKQIENQLDHVYGNSVPVEIQSLYAQGHAAVNSLENSLPDDVEQAKEDFLTAMKSFMQISRMISGSVTEAKVATSTTVSDRDLSSELDRLEKYVQNLKTISEKHNTGINFEKIDSLINEAHNQLDDGTGNPSEIIDKLKRLINSIQKDIREFASQGASDRIKQFVDKQLGKIEKKLTRALDAGAADAQIDKAHELIDQIKVLISENEIDNAKMVFHELNKLMKNIERSVR